MTISTVYPIATDDGYLYSIVNKNQFIDSDTVGGTEGTDLVTKDDALTIKKHINRISGHRLPSVVVYPHVNNTGTTTISYYLYFTGYMYATLVEKVELIISDTEDFSTILDTTITSSGQSYTPRLVDTRTYYAKARAISASMVGEWGETVSFVVNGVNNYVSAVSAMAVKDGRDIICRLLGTFNIDGISSINNLSITIYENGVYKTTVYLTVTDINEVFTIEDILLPNREYRIDVAGNVDGGAAYTYLTATHIEDNKERSIVTKTRILNHTLSNEGFILSSNKELYYVNSRLYTTSGTIRTYMNIAPIDNGFVYASGAAGQVYDVSVSPSATHLALKTYFTTSETWITVYSSGVGSTAVTHTFPKNRNVAVDDAGYLMYTGGLGGTDTTVYYNKPGAVVTDLGVVLYYPIPVITVDQILVIFGSESNGGNMESMYVIKPPYNNPVNVLLSKGFDNRYDSACALPNGLVVIRYRNTIYKINVRSSNPYLKHVYTLPVQNDLDYGNIVPVGNNEIAVLDNRNGVEKVLTIGVV